MKIVWKVLGGCVGWNTTLERCEWVIHEIKDMKWSL